MFEDAPFRWLFVAIVVLNIGVSAYYRRRAGRAEAPPSRLDESRVLIAGRVLLAGPLFLSILAYAIDPRWMAWSSLPLPGWLRWPAAGAGLATPLLTVWVLSHLGPNVTETVLTKRGHRLVTSGPYRFIRHPLYAAGAAAFLSAGVTAANAFMLLVTLLIVAMLIVLVIPREEAALVEKFGDLYRDYTGRTGRLLPRVSRRA